MVFFYNIPIDIFWNWWSGESGESGKPGQWRLLVNTYTTLKRFEQKYLLLSGFTFEVVQISLANTLHSIHV